jgi:hypothetical protein
MKITASQLRKIINEEIARLSEADPPAKSGTETAKDVGGTLDINKIANTLQLDAAKLKTALDNLRKGNRKSADNQTLGDLVATLMKASDQDIIKIMNVFKQLKTD